MRADEAIQFAPVKVDTPEPWQPPGWLEALFKAFRPVFELIGSLGPAMKVALIGAAVLLVALFIWWLKNPVLNWLRRERPAPAEEPEWQPDNGAALALLEDADRLAAEGRFDEATHLLLQRSVGQIASARPGLLEPSSTAREIAALPALPEKARHAFGVIAARVERSLFALRSLSQDDWLAAREAYSAFALEARAGRA